MQLTAGFSCIFIELTSHRRDPVSVCIQILALFLAERQIMDFESLYQQYRSYVWTICYRILGNEADTEDAVQETFIKAITSIHTFNPAKGEMKTWLGKIAHNVSIDILRRKGRFTELKDIAYEIDLNNADFEALQQCLSQLPEKQRLALILKRVSQNRWEDVALLMGLTVDQVRYLEELARNSMKRCMSKE